MPVIFYYHNNVNLRKYYGKYVNGTGWVEGAAGYDWNSPQVITDAPTDGPNTAIQTEAGILETMRSKASSYASADSVPDGKAFYKCIVDIANEKSDETVYVLKGVHTKPALHFSIGFTGRLYHLNVQRQGADTTKFSIISMSAGPQVHDDPEWKVVKK